MYKVGQEYTHKYSKGYTCRITEIKPDGSIWAEWCSEKPLNSLGFIKGPMDWPKGLLVDYYVLTKDVEETKENKMFEVGKKYKTKVSNVTYTCLWVDNTGGLIENDEAKYRFFETDTEWYEEIKPEPVIVHKAGWINIGNNKNIYKTKEEAEMVLTTNQKKAVRATVFVEWDEEVLDSVPADDEI